MRGRSHRCLGEYLADHYLADIPFHYRQAFLVGCVEPDLNPLTYLKGSIRCQWLRGHNYRNARRFMRAISWRLEKRKVMRTWDYYTLGKLIHYVTDAFTYAHNDAFSSDLSDHREYEAALQEHFLQYIQDDPKIDIHTARTIMEAIYSYHREYESCLADVHTDAKFVLRVCCCILSILFVKPIM